MKNKTAMGKKTRIVKKKVNEIMCLCKDGVGGISRLDNDIDAIYSFIYKNGLQEIICGHTIALFYSEKGRKYTACVPISRRVPSSQDMEVRILPPLRCVSYVHRERDINESFALLKKYFQKNKLKWVYPIREIYIPTEGTSNYIIEIQIPYEKTF